MGVIYYRTYRKIRGIRKRKFFFVRKRRIVMSCVGRENSAPKQMQEE